MTDFRVGCDDYIYLIFVDKDEKEVVITIIINVDFSFLTVDWVEDNNVNFVYVYEKGIRENYEGRKWKKVI